MPDKPTTAIAVLLLLLTRAAAAELTVSGAWLREPPPVSAPVAGYLALENSGTETVTIEAISSPRFDRIEWHTVRMEYGVARMRRVDAPVLAAGGRRVFKPGSDHLMLFGAEGALRAGDRVRLEIRTTGGEVLQFEAEVRAPGADGGAHQHHHH